MGWFSDLFGGGDVPEPIPQVVGFRFYASMVLNVVLGRIDSITHVYYGDKIAWEGSVTATGPLQINASDLYGGEEEEGGISGTLYLQFGDPTQPANSFLQDIFPIVPAFRKRFTAVAQDMYLGTSRYIKTIGFVATRYHRTVDGGTSWYDAQVDLGNGMNPAHIIRECLTSKSFGCNVSSSLIDDTSFTQAADTLAAENFGLSFLFDQKRTQVSTFIQMVLDHIEGILYLDPLTGLYNLILIRQNYNAGALTLYTEDDYIEITGFSRVNTGDLPNEVIVRYIDKEKWEETICYAHNIASIQAKGSKISIEKDFQGIHDHSLAARVAGRELLESSTASFNCSIKASRRMFGLRPGDVVKLKMTQYGIEETIVRVLGVKEGNLKDNSITLLVAEDVFGVSHALYSDREDTGWTNPVDQIPIDYEVTLLFEIPYWILANTWGQDEVDGWGDDRGYIGVAPRDSNNSSGYSIYEDSIGAYRQVGLQRATAPYFENAIQVPLQAEDTEISIQNTSEWDMIQVGALCFMGDELILIKEILTSTIIIGRGLLDSVPRQHPIGTPTLAFSGRYGTSTLHYNDGDSFNVKLVPYNNNGTLVIDDATPHNITMASRYLRPYPVGDFKYTESGGDLLFTWKHRNRTDHTPHYLVEQTDASQLIDTGATYSWAVFDGAVQIRVVASLVGESLTYAEEDRAHDFGLTIEGASLTPDIIGDYFENGTYGTKDKFEDGVYSAWWNTGTSEWFITLIADIGNVSASGFKASTLTGTYTATGGAVGSPSVVIKTQGYVITYENKTTKDTLDSWKTWKIS